MSTFKDSAAPDRGDDNDNDDTLPSSSLKDRILSFSQWWQQQQHHHDSHTSPSSSDSEIAPQLPIRLVDLRSSSEQEKQRLSFSSNFNNNNNTAIVVSLPIEFLQARSFELPARHIQFDILLDERDIPKAEAVLLGVRSGVVRKRPQNPWKVRNVLLEVVDSVTSDRDLWKPAEELGLVSHHYLKRSTFPLPRLWQPDPMVETVLLPLLLKQQQQGEKQHRSGSKRVQVLDLASGSGRDVVFLAEELAASGCSTCRVVGIDHRYNEKETSVVRAFWKRRGVEHQTDSLKLDLSLFETLDQSMIPLVDVTAIFCVRFWKAELVRAIATSLLLPSGILFGLSHFCKPHPGAPWNFEHPSEKTVLERDELSDLFCDDTWEILHDEIATDSDHGRTMIHFVAQKR